MKRFQSVFIALIFVLGVFAPYSHVLLGEAHGHDVCLHEEAAKPGVSLEEHCGGSQNPCSRPDHDHHSKDRDDHKCLVCKSVKNAFVTQAFSHERSSFAEAEPLFFPYEVIPQDIFSYSFFSRAPPLFF